MINVTTKGDVTKAWRLILIGYVEVLVSPEKQGSRLSKLNQSMNDTRSYGSVSNMRQKLSKQGSINETKQTTFT